MTFSEFSQAKHLPTRFYYGDERLANGDFASGAISGVAHAERYWELSQDRKQRQWMDTFVAGQGYKEFPKA